MMPGDVRYDRQRLIELLQRDSLKRGTFTLASGRTSHYYVDGRKVTLSLVRHLIQEELARILDERGEDRFEGGHFPLAARLFDQLVASDGLEQFFTLKAYPLLDDASEITDVAEERGNEPIASALQRDPGEVAEEAISALMTN